MSYTENITVVCRPRNVKKEVCFEYLDVNRFLSLFKINAANNKICASKSLARFRLE